MSGRKAGLHHALRQCAAQSSRRTAASIQIYAFCTARVSRSPEEHDHASINTLNNQPHNLRLASSQLQLANQAAGPPQVHMKRRSLQRGVACLGMSA